MMVKQAIMNGCPDRRTEVKSKVSSNFILLLREGGNPCGQTTSGTFSFRPFVFLFKNKLLGILCILCGMALCSCERRDLTYYEVSEITLTADWSRAGLGEEEKDYGATVIFYPQDGSEPKVFLMGERTGDVVRLPEGTYRIVLFNRSFDDFSNLSFRGREGYETLEAHARKVDTRMDGTGRTETRTIVGPPDALAAATIEGFTVTEDMLGNYSHTDYGRSGKSRMTEKSGVGEDRYALHFIPKKLTREVIAKIHIKGLNNVRSATCRLDGVAESVFLASGKISPQTVTQEFRLADPQFDEGSPFDGIMTSTFEVFGIRLCDHCSLHLEALLADGKTVFTSDYTDAKVSELENGDGTISVYVELATDKIPDVKPEGGSGSGFDVDVDGWGDEVTTEVPIE